MILMHIKENVDEDDHDGTYTSFHLHLFALRPLSFIVIMHLICIGRDVKFFTNSG